MGTLSRNSSGTKELPEEYRSPAVLATFRFGPVNLIGVDRIAAFYAWEQGTQALLRERPVTRERAIQVFQELFSKL